MRKSWFTIRNKQEAEELAAAIQELLGGKEYLFINTYEGRLDPDIYVQHHLTCGFNSSDTPFMVYSTPELTDDVDLWMSDTYGLHFFRGKDTECVYINWGKGQLSHIGKIGFKRDRAACTVYQITGEYNGS